MDDLYSQKKYDEVLSHFRMAPSSIEYIALKELGVDVSNIIDLFHERRLTKDQYPAAKRAARIYHNRVTAYKRE